VYVAGLLRTRRDNSGVDPLTTGAKRPLNSRYDSRCDAAFQNNISRKVVTLCVPNSTRRSGGKQWWFLTMFTWYLMTADTYSAYPLSMVMVSLKVISALCTN